MNTCAKKIFIMGAFLGMCAVISSPSTFAASAKKSHQGLIQSLSSSAEKSGRNLHQRVAALDLALYIQNETGIEDTKQTRQALIQKIALVSNLARASEDFSKNKTDFDSSSRLDDLLNPGWDRPAKTAALGLQIRTEPTREDPKDKQSKAKKRDGETASSEGKKARKSEIKSKREVALQKREANARMKMGLSARGGDRSGNRQASAALASNMSFARKALSGELKHVRNVIAKQTRASLSRSVSRSVGESIREGTKQTRKQLKRKLERKKRQRPPRGGGRPPGRGGGPPGGRGR